MVKKTMDHLSFICCMLAFMIVCMCVYVYTLSEICESGFRFCTAHELKYFWRFHTVQLQASHWLHEGIGGDNKKFYFDFSFFTSFEDTLFILEVVSGRFNSSIRNLMTTLGNIFVLIICMPNGNISRPSYFELMERIDCAIKKHCSFSMHITCMQ